MMWFMLYLLCWGFTSFGLGWWVAYEQDGVMSVKDILIVFAAGIIWPLVVVGGAIFWIGEESHKVEVDFSKWIKPNKEEADEQ